uniref:ARAD1B01408p n=1 Tax=Blastobotrys adeninivorans TaxID=409370 RepID=A0A060T9R6_BLAAD
MIHSVIIVNNSGQPRLIKFYTPVDIQTQSLLVKQVHSILSSRSDNQCSFLTPPPLLLEGMEDEVIRVIYRHYATLYFVFIVDEQESELGILDLIQVFVESLDRCFENVCELDLVFGWQVLQTVLGEMIQGGMVVETNINKIVAAVDEANRGTSSSGSSGPPRGSSGDSSTFSKAFSNASSAFQAIARDGLWSGR